MNRNEKGFSLTEIVVAMGLLGGIGLVATTMTSQMSSQQNSMGVKSDAQMFMSSFNSFLLSPKGCEALKSKALQGVYSSQSNLSISNFTGFGVKANQTITGGTEISRGIKLLSLNYKKKAGVDKIVKVGGSEVLQTIVQVAYELEAGNKVMEKLLEIPVVAEKAGNQKITNCAGADAMDNSSLCSMAGMTYDKTTGECKAEEQCQVKGSYAERSCYAAGKTCTAQSVTTYFQPKKNPITNSYGCPAGATPVTTARVSGTHKVSTGKKSSYTVTDYETNYICMQCPTTASGSTGSTGGSSGGYTGGGGGSGGFAKPGSSLMLK